MSQCRGTYAVPILLKLRTRDKCGTRHVGAASACLIIKNVVGIGVISCARAFSPDSFAPRLATRRQQPVCRTRFGRPRSATLRNMVSRCRGKPVF